MEVIVPNSASRPSPVPGPEGAALTLFGLVAARFHETFRVSAGNVFAREYRVIYENTGTEPAFFVLGSAHRKYSQVDMEAYDRDQLCEFVPSYRAMEITVLFLILAMQTEIGRVVRDRVKSRPDADQLLTQLRANVVQTMGSLVGQLVRCDPGNGNEPPPGDKILAEIERVKVEAKDSGGQTVVSLNAWASLPDWLHSLLNLLSTDYVEILQLTDPLQPKTFRLVMLRVRRIVSHESRAEEIHSLHRGYRQIYFEAPLGSVSAVDIAEPIRQAAVSTHIRVVPPDGLVLPIDTNVKKRIAAGIAELPAAAVAAMTLTAILFLAAGDPFRWAFPLLALLALFLNFIRIGGERYLSSFSWEPRKSIGGGFRSWEADFSITTDNGDAIDRNNVIIAHRDPGLVYLVFNPIPLGAYRIRATFSLPKFHDRAPYLISLVAWIVIYSTLFSYGFGGGLDSTSVLHAYWSNLHHVFATGSAFSSIVIPMFGIGVSMSIASLIHFINRTPAQRQLLQNLLATLILLTGLAVFLPAIMASVL